MKSRTQCPTRRMKRRSEISLTDDERTAVEVARYREEIGAHGVYSWEDRTRLLAIIDRLVPRTSVTR